MTNPKAKETLLWCLDLFRRGLFPGAVGGGVVGLAPGVLLVLVLTGGDYRIGGGEVLGFIVMSVAAGALLGAGLGGVCALAGGGAMRAWRRLRR